MKVAIGGTFDPLHDGHKKLKLEHAKAADGKTISSTKIKAGEIKLQSAKVKINFSLEKKV